MFSHVWLMWRWKICKFNFFVRRSLELWFISVTFNVEKKLIKISMTEPMKIIKRRQNLRIFYLWSHYIAQMNSLLSELIPFSHTPRHTTPDSRQFPMNAYFTFNRKKNICNAINSGKSLAMSLISLHIQHLKNIRNARFTTQRLHRRVEGTKKTWKIQIDTSNINHNNGVIVS